MICSYILLLIKGRGKKKYFLLFIKYYKEIFNTNDIFIIDRENVKKNFFFFFYHTLIGGPTFFFFNKEKEKGSITCNIPKKQNKQKKKMIIKKRLSYILYNKTNYPRNISFFFGKRKNNKIINLITRNRRKPYFINLNNNELKYNSTDNYIIFFLYDLIFNHNFDIYKYMYTNLEREEEEEEEKHTHNSFICTFNKNKNKNKSIKLNNILKDKLKNGRIILFTNCTQTELQSIYKYEMDNENMNDINYNPNKYDNCDDLYKIIKSGLTSLLMNLMILI
ncbi:hypothetical protein PFDG_03085 [Plasmodium falciparum Dd2]|uniref:Uncharacterized protein n=1 Tax=Plasmodium falciparum (isolate Dd2) TaxID=57267 RepID=A0A0L7M2T8_PLAF4|nr:hypothetical protein PFDG_03085 [Plasmodium falciparum Dd2]